MKIGYFSDLHTEFLKPDVVLAARQNLSRYDERVVSVETFAEQMGEAYLNADVIVAAGDIGTGVKAIHFLRDAFPDKPVIYIPGNHDHWGGEIHSNHRKMKEAAAGSNVHFFHDGGTIEIDGVLFCAATLWTDYELTNNSARDMRTAMGRMNDFAQISIGSKREYTMMEATSIMKDFMKIRIRRNSSQVYNREEQTRRLQPNDLLVLHRRHLANIKAAMVMARAAGKKLVVVSHHAPCDRSLLWRSTPEDMASYVYEKSDPAYASHLDYLMFSDDAPTLWIHGHTHIHVMYEQGKTLVVSNPKGYNFGDDTDWEIGRLIEIASNGS